MDANVPPIGEQLESVERLTKDLKLAARTLTRGEARFLVDAYYAMQRDRIRAAHQARTLSEGAEPHGVMNWLYGQRERLELEVARALDAYSGAHLVGDWARSIVGIGPIIAAGLLAHIDIEKAPTAGHIWRYAGLDPSVKWEKGKVRPWNAELKRLCFLIGESFVKVSGNPKDTYGKVYKRRKELESRKNLRKVFREQAVAALAAKNFGADTEARKWYEKGMLPPARIHLRAKRYAVKIFLSHYHHVLHETELLTPPRVPYSTEQLGHTQYIAPPNWKVGKNEFYKEFDLDWIDQAIINENLLLSEDGVVLPAEAESEGG